MTCIVQAEESEITVKDLFTNFFIDETKPENLTTLRFSYGLTSIDPKFFLPEKMASAYTSQIDYGFTRIRDYEKYPSIFAHSSEFAFFGNISSHLKPKSIAKDGFTVDAWRFGFGIRNGMGYNFSNAKLFLSHLGAIAWTRTDFENLSQIKQNQDIQLKFDEKMKFGTVYSGGVELSLFSFLNIAVDYEHAIVLKNYTATSLIGSWMIDNILQRWIDFIDPILMREFKENYPLIKWFYKNSISIMLYEIRSRSGGFPFESSPPMNFRSGIIRLNLLL